MTKKELDKVIDNFSQFISENTPLIVTNITIEEFYNSKYGKELLLQVIVDNGL